MDIESINFNELRDAEIVARMRKCNYEKFKTLVRMHLSFELELNTDEFDLPCHEIVYEDKGKLKKWNRLSKKHKHASVMAAALATGSAGCASVVGGGANHKSAGNSGSGGGYCVSGSPPEGLHQQIDAGFLFHMQELKEFLMLEKNLQQEGIFRKTGSASRQNDLRSQIQNDKPLHLEAGGYSAHDCATVFKGYLAELPEPLLTDAHYPAHLQIAPLCMGINHHMEDHLNVSKREKSSCNSERSKKELHVLNSIQLLLLLLPDENRQLLQNIIDMLHAVAVQQSINKMGPDNLATLFAPHLICPRNLPPEALHYLAKKMSSMIAYMIVRGQDIFSVPAKLATDIRAYFLERKRKKTMSPEMLLDDSISDISTVNTVYTFVDREKTAAAKTTNNTDTELAQLYAHIQSMPESSRKRRLIKQFNKQNGQGTPLQLQAMNRLKNSETSRTAKSLSDSIKKHIFHNIYSRTPKRQQVPTIVTETPNNSSMKHHKQRSEPNLSNICDTPTSSLMAHIQSGAGGYEMITPITKHTTGGKSLTRKLIKGVSMGNLKFPFSTPESTKRLVRTVSSTLKRRSSDDSQIYQQAEGSFAAAIKSGNAPLLLDMDDNDLDDDTFEDDPNDDCGEGDATETEDDLDEDQPDHFAEHISLMTAGTGSSSSELTACFSGGPTSYQQLLLQQSSLYHRNLDLVTSTPSLLLGRRSMSPITKSTQRMPKAMQESIMTPRSRKPVMVLTTNASSTDQNQTINHTDLSNYHERAAAEGEEESDEGDDGDDTTDDGDEDEILIVTKSKSQEQQTAAAPQPEIINEDATSLGGYSDIFRRQQLLHANQSFVQQTSIALGLSSDDSNTNSNSNGVKNNTLALNANNADELTKHFKEYLLTRSVLTAPPEDASFTTHSDDFDSSHEIEDLDENQLSSSLLYCLDGNRPDPANDTDATSSTETLDEHNDTTSSNNEDTNNEQRNIKFQEFSTAVAGSSRMTSTTTSAAGAASHIPIITTNRLATNPFVILNNARKRAASNDLDKISSTLFNSHHHHYPNQNSQGLKSIDTSNTNINTTRQQQFSPLMKNNSTNSNTNSSSNKENCEHNENYVVSKKLLISEYPGETSF